MAIDDASISQDPSEVNHCLSIDVEGFVEGMAESFAVPREYFDDAAADREIDVNVREILEFFDRLRLKATFYVLGRIAERNPALMKSIAGAGHELGSHSYYHKRIFNQSREEFRTDIKRSKDAIEQATGEAALGFRAPDFSIRPDSLWILDEIKDAGFLYDSSLTPTNVHDVYGMKDVSPMIHRLPNGLWEFPASTFSILGRKIPYAGGGYLRLYPVWLTRLLIRRCATSGHPAMIYMHPYELGSQIVNIKPLSAMRRFRHYYHCKNGLPRFERILSGLRIGRARDILLQYGMGTNG